MGLIDSNDAVSVGCCWEGQGQVEGSMRMLGVQREM